MPGEQQTEEEEEEKEEEEMKEEMVLLVKGEEDEGEKYEVVKLRIPMDKEVRVAHPGAPLALGTNCSCYVLKPRSDPASLRQKPGIQTLD